MKKGKKCMLIICGVILVLIMVLLGGAWSMFGDMIKAANSVTKLQDGLYAMEYRGDYGFDGFLARGGAASDAEVADYLIEFLSHGFYKPEVKAEGGEFGCSAICEPKTDGGYLYGRNYDWADCRAMAIHTVPKEGYESVSTSCIDFLGFGEDYAPDASMMTRMEALAAIYVPLDGMNEKGLMVADLMAGDKEKTRQNTGKTRLTTTTAIRLLLDRAASVEEALELLRGYDMNSSIDSAHHLFIADASGRSVAVEYVANEMIVTDSEILTNHYLAAGEKQGMGSGQSHIRFDALSEIRSFEGIQAVKTALMSVAQYNYPQSEGRYEKTMWSIAYDPEALSAQLWFAEDFSEGYGMRLKDEKGWLALPGGSEGR